MGFFRTLPCCCSTTNFELGCASIFHYLVRQILSPMRLNFYYLVRRFLRQNEGRIDTTKFEAHGAHFLLFGTTIFEAEWREKELSGPQVVLMSTTKFEAHGVHFVILGTTIFELQ